MAGVIRDLLEAQAPGVFFGDQASGLSYSPVIKEGTLEKLGRGRGIIGGFLSKKWAPRTFKVHEDFRMQYIDKDVLRGELPIERARIESIPKEDERAGDKDFVFEITTKEDERVYLAAASEEERSEWIACLRDVSSGKFKLNRYLDLLRQALLLPETQKLKIEFDYEELKKVMNADGYGEERMMEIIEQYLINIHSHLVRYIAEDAIYRDLFLSRFDTFQIRLIHAEDKDTSKGYYRTHFRNGELQIHYVQAWTNIAQCGEDLNKSISEGEPIPYLVYKSIRRYEPTMHSYINGIERLLNITGVSYDYAVDVNYPAMIAGNYGPERFGEIFIQEYLRAFIEKLSRFIAEDSAGFIPAFNRRFKSKRITIQATTNPSAMNGYWKSSFNSAGDLVILYRSVWTNLSQLGEDFTSLLQGGDDDSESGGGAGVPYKVSKSIREKEATLQAHLHRLEQLLSIRGIQYDYNVQLNLPAMISAGYGEDRFGEIFLDEYIKNLISTIESFIKKDSSFIPAFNQKFFGKKIVIHIASNPNETKSYNDSSFTADGNLLIVYRYVWTNISSIGQDIPALLTEGDVPFIVAESIHKTQSTLQSHLKRIEYLFNISGVTYDYVVASNLPAMRNSGYGDDRFGEIFLDEHLKNLIATFEQHIQEDRVFIDVFNRYFKSRKIVIRPASDPNNTKSYYDSSFTAQGDLLIEYRYVWTNISNIGRDLPSILLDDNDVPYIVAVSIRKTQSTLQSHLHSLEQVFGVTGITYDYAVASNLPAMRDSGYGDDRFGEIFLDEYLKNLVATVRSLGADPGFASAFRSKFTGRKIIIKIASDPNNLQNYYDSSFTAQGDLLIEYRYVWTNISNIGRDIPTRL